MTRLKHISSIIRNFLFSSVNKEFLVFLFFLALSGIFWLLMTLNETFEKEVRIPVKIVNIPKNVVLTSDEMDTISVVLRDKGLTLLGYQYGSNGKRTINISFKDYARRNGYGMVTSAELQQLIGKQLPASTSITELKTEFIEYFYSNGVSKRVPVRWTGQVTPEQPYFISSVHYYPDSVDVYASENKLDSINVAYTAPLNYSDFRDSLSIETSMQRDRGVKTIPATVRIKFLTDILTEESIENIHIKGINMPKGMVLRTFPSTVNVRFVTGVSRYRTIRPEDFSVVVDYNDIIAKPSEKCTLRLASTPSGISRASLNITQIDYLIEEEESEVPTDTIN